jgi:hypothetical protein
MTPTLIPAIISFLLTVMVLSYLFGALSPTYLWVSPQAMWLLSLFTR